MRPTVRRASDTKWVLTAPPHGDHPPLTPPQPFIPPTDDELKAALDVNYGSWILEHWGDATFLVTMRPPRTVGWGRIRKLADRKDLGEEEEDDDVVRGLREQVRCVAWD